MVKPALVSDSEAYAGRKIAWVREFDAEGRTWLETPDLTLVPKDKVRGMTASTLEGIDLKKNPDMSLPLAFTWIGDAPKLRKAPDGSLTETGESYPRHTFIPVEPNLVHERGGFYWVTKDGFLVHNDLFTIMKQRTDRPKGVGPHDKWIDVKNHMGNVGRLRRRHAGIRHSRVARPRRDHPAFERAQHEPRALLTSAGSSIRPT